MESKQEAGVASLPPASTNYLPEEEAILLRIFSRFFITIPDEPLIQLLKDTSFGEIVRALCEPEDFQSLSSLLVKSNEELLEALQLEYSRLFSVPGTTYVPPFESYYKDRWTIPLCTGGVITAQGLLYGDATIAVKKLYAAEGLGPNQTLGEPPDHISLEIAFLALLLEKRLEAEQQRNFNLRDVYKQKQEQFVKDHLFPFCEKFATNLEQKAKLPLYPLLAKALLRLLTSI